MTFLLSDVFFRDPARGREELAGLGEVPDSVFQAITLVVRQSPDPDQTVNYLNRLRAASPPDFGRVVSDPSALRFAAAVFGQSVFLSEAILRDPGWLLHLSAAEDLRRVLRKDEYEVRLRQYAPSPGSLARSPELLAGFRKRELLRIFLRDSLEMGSLSDITEEISNLADAILSASVTAIRNDLDAMQPGAAFSVIALGKLGGRELNYSSDIDLLFVYTGEDSGEWFQKVAKRLTETLSTYTSDGLCYRVDLRLRPDGRYGEICHSLDAAKQYYATRARDWELQMLIKARLAAGDPGPAQCLLDFVDPLIYSTTLDFEAVEAVSEARQRIHEKLKRARQGGLNVKLTSGGIRDIEFLVQCLQRLHGGREPWLRHGGTMLALARLRDKNFLSDHEYSQLLSAYQFLRHLEHRVQIREDRQTHNLPTDPEQLETLARRMPPSLFREPSAKALEDELDGHLRAVRNLYERVIHSQRRDYLVEAAPAAFHPPPREEPPTQPVFPSTHLARFLNQRAPLFMERLRAAQLNRGQQRFEHLLEKISQEPGLLELLEIDPELTQATFAFFENSAYFGDQLLRNPGLLLEIAEGCGERQGRVGFHAPENLTGLRRYYREQMVRIQSDSVHCGIDVFKTLKRTSGLADAVVAAAYRIALAEVCELSAPASPTYQPCDQMMVIALGRLGMREFDIGSDADLAFALPDADAHEAAFWTQVAERLIHVISAYTGDGVIFTVDTRLRPHGREGDLVQTESVFRAYFADTAEAWEGIAYMKARAVAGNLESATRFLHELQQVDWRRYGQSGRSRLLLAEMRAKIEKEQGARNPLKAGAGGYYDLDFALLYLRLKGAGMFFKALNTPERIAVVEKMGHLDREDAAQMLETATLYRAIDHGMRVGTGHADGSLPTSPSSRAALGELVRRWAPESLREQNSEALFQGTLAMVRSRTRALFDRVFS